MQLLVSPTSPFARKTRMMAIEKKFGEDELEIVDANPWLNFTGVVDHNPLNKVPILVLPDGSVLVDSKVIADYLDSVRPPHLVPREAEARARVKSLEALADGATDAVAAGIMAARVDAETPISEKWREWQREKARRAFSHFDEILRRDDFLHGDELSLADIALACALGFADFRAPRIAMAARLQTAGRVAGKNENARIVRANRAAAASPLAAGRESGGQRLIRRLLGRLRAVVKLRDDPPHDGVGGGLDGLVDSVRRQSRIAGDRVKRAPAVVGHARAHAHKAARFFAEQRLKADWLLVFEFGEGYLQNQIFAARESARRIQPPLQQLPQTGADLGRRVRPRGAVFDEQFFRRRVGVSRLPRRGRSRRFNRRGNDLLVLFGLFRLLGLRIDDKRALQRHARASGQSERCAQKNRPSPHRIRFHRRSL